MNKAINDKLEDYFTINLFSKNESEYRAKKVKSVFKNILDGSENNDLLSAQINFCTEPPFTYWNINLVKEISNYVRNNYKFVDKFDEAIKYFDLVLFHILDTTNSDDEKKHNLNDAKELKNLFFAIMPYHLRMIEHIYINLLRFLWTLETDSSFKDAKGAIAKFSNVFENDISKGYQDRIRNGLAHGQVTFQDNYILFGKSPYEKNIYVSDYEKQLDHLWETSNSITLGILLGLSSILNKQQHLLCRLPPRTTAYYLSGIRSHDYFKIENAIETESHRGKELVLFVKAPKSGYNVFIFECLQTALASRFLTKGKYDWVQFSVDTGIEVDSLSIVNAKSLETGAIKNTPIENLKDIINPALFWDTYGKNMERLQTCKRIYSQNKKITNRDNSLRIRHIKNASAGRLGRIDVIATLCNGVHLDTETDIIEELIKLTNKLKNYILWVPSSKFEGGISFPTIPQYIWINLYKEDKSLRQIGNGGWSGNNLLASSEYIKFPWLKPLQPHDPDHKKNQIRFITKKPKIFRD